MFFILSFFLRGENMLYSSTFTIFNNKYYHLQKMGNVEFQVSDHLRREWVQDSLNNNRSFYNKVTSQSFSFMVLTKLEGEGQVSALIQRSIYPVPKTPKIIILNDKQGQISILVQRKTRSLKTILSVLLLQLQLFQIILEIVAILQAIVYRYGHFSLTQNMFGGTNNNQPIIWINESFENCKIQYPLPLNSNPQHLMLSQFLNIFRNNSPLELTHELFVCPPISFDRFLNQLRQLIRIQRYGLNTQKLAVSNKIITPPYPFSPRNTFTRLKNTKLQNESERAKEGRKVQHIPNFIKIIKDKKQKVVQDLNKPNSQDDQFLTNSRHGKISQSQKNNRIFVGKLRSLNVSPTSTIKTQPRSDATFKTNNSTISWKMSNKGIPSFLTFSKKSQECKPNRQAQSQKKIFLNGMNSCFKQKLGLQQSKEGKDYDDPFCIEQKEIQVTFEKQVSKISNSALHSFCKNIYESQELNQVNILEQGCAQKDVLGNLLQESRDRKYRVVVHDELKYQISGKEQQISIDQQFSRVIY